MDTKDQETRIIFYIRQHGPVARVNKTLVTGLAEAI